MYGAVITKEDFEKKRNKFAREDYDRLEKLYDKALHESKVMKASKIAKIIYDKFGIGESDEVFGYGEEKQY